MIEENKDYRTGNSDEEDEEHLALIVEDDKINQNYISKALGLKGYKCKTASTVTQALEHIDAVIKMNQHFEVIFLDIILEDEQTGLDFLRIRKERKLDEKGIVIVMTGNEELHVVQECNKYNIQNYIKKPVSSTNLEYEIMRVNDEVKKQKCPIKGYKNEKKIGHGGTGEVFLVRHKATQQLYAMKRVPNDDKKINTETAYHLGLKAPTILELKESRIFEGNIYMIIEYAENGTLSDWIGHQRLNYKTYKVEANQILLWMTELFLGLFTTHEKNLIHRDIKSDNLFLCKDNVLKIGDLGIAKAIEKSAFTVCGTHHYMAPEIHKKGEYDTKADIWAAGVVLYELIMLEKPFDGSSDEIIEKVLKMDCKPIPKTVDSRLHTLLKHTLNPDNHARLTSKEILKLDFMSEMLSLINSEGIFPIDEETMYRIAKDNSAPEEVSKEKIKETIQKNEAQSKLMKQYFNYFNIAMKLDASAINKTTYQKSYFSKKFENVVSGLDLATSAEEYNIKPEVISELIQNKFIINVSNPNEEEFIDDNKNFYQIVLIEDLAVDNSTVCPPNYSEAKSKSPLKITQDCLEMALIIWKKIEDEGEDDEESKMNILCSKEYFDFLVEIIQIKNINFTKLTKNEKLASILNIYQVMFLHLLIKMELGSETSSKKSGGLLGKVKSLVFSGTGKNDITYNIGGYNMSLYDLKHITIRRNKKPLDAYMRLASSGDAREKLIDGGENNKYLFVCLDPPQKSVEDMTLKPNFYKFSEEVNKELDDYIREFVAANFQIDDSEISIPRFLKDYLVDFSNNEQDLVRFLLKYHADETIKFSKIAKEMNNKSINVNYY